MNDFRILILFSLFLFLSLRLLRAKAVIAAQGKAGKKKKWSKVSFFLSKKVMKIDETDELLLSFVNREK